jgi:hypothetical protein
VPAARARKARPRSVDPSQLTVRLSGAGGARRQPTNPVDPLPGFRGSEASGLRIASPHRFARRISRARALSACSGELARRAGTRRFRQRQAVRTPLGHGRAAARVALRDSARSAGEPPGAQHDRQPDGCLRSRRGHYLRPQRADALSAGGNPDDRFRGPSAARTDERSAMIRSRRPNSVGRGACDRIWPERRVRSKACDDASGRERAPPRANAGHRLSQPRSVGS